jgi:hypothetical protein
MPGSRVRVPLSPPIKIIVFQLLSSPHRSMLPDLVALSLTPIAMDCRNDGLRVPHREWIGFRPISLP